MTLRQDADTIISAALNAAQPDTAVRKALAEGDFETVKEMTPESTWRFFASEEAEPVLLALFRGSVI